MILPERDPQPAYPEYDALRALAVRRGRFANARDLALMQDVARRRGHRWCSAVIGFTFPGLGAVSSTDAALLLVADEADIDPPLPPMLAEAFTAGDRHQAAERAAADQREHAAAETYCKEVMRWAAVREALPVKVEVRHNYTSHRHLDGYVQGGDHIYLLDDLAVGRLKRPSHEVLCWTLSRARDLEHFPEPAGDDRLPTCKACWRTAERIAALILAASGQSAAAAGSGAA